MDPHSLGAMRRDWQQRAADDARHYIACTEAGGLAFSLSGLRDAAAILQDVHPFLDERARVLESAAASDD
jgi:Zn-dependent protease with chaperone function